MFRKIAFALALAAFATPISIASAEKKNSGDDDVYPEYTCQASAASGGPLFSAVSNDMAQAMDEAQQTCESQMGTTCWNQGCTMTNS